jgi:hypothetical protein
MSTKNNSHKGNTIDNIVKKAIDYLKNLIKPQKDNDAKQGPVTTIKINNQGFLEEAKNPFNKKVQEVLKERNNEKSVDNKELESNNSGLKVEKIEKGQDSFVTTKFKI